MLCTPCLPCSSNLGSLSLSAIPFTGLDICFLASRAWNLFTSYCARVQSISNEEIILIELSSTTIRYHRVLLKSWSPIKRRQMHILKQPRLL